MEASAGTGAFPFYMPKQIHLYVFECSCPIKHRWCSADKTAADGITCQDDGAYRTSGRITQMEGETLTHAKYRALLTRFATIN